MLAALAAPGRRACRGCDCAASCASRRPTQTAARAAPRFAELAALLEELNAAGGGPDTLSMGMSADFEAAICEGATIVRIGTALFGARPLSAHSLQSAAMGAHHLAILGGGHMGRALISGLLRRGIAARAISRWPRSTRRPGRACRRDLRVQRLCRRRSRPSAVPTRGRHRRQTSGRRGAARARCARSLQQTPPARRIHRRRNPHRIAAAAGAAPASPVVRAMPNRAGARRRGGERAVCPAGGEPRLRAPPRRRCCARWVRSCGCSSEDALDVVTALSGSGPAYFFSLAEAMMQAARRPRP